MMKINITFRILLITGVIVFTTSSSVAKSSRKRVPKEKSGQLMTSINDARARSDKDQDKMKKQVDYETQDKINAWGERSTGVIEIKHTGTSPYDAGIDLGRADHSLEDEGEDHSGLSGLRSRVEEESTDINFDEELREVSSLKDLKK